MDTNDDALTSPATDPTDVSPATAPTGTDDASMVLELESMIKSGMTTLDRNKAELKKLNEMLESALLNDEAYSAATEKVKEAAKEKGKAKAVVMEVPATKQLAEKVKDMKQENKDLATAQSEYLREYARLSGSTEIETDDGEVREIIYIAKLIKKSKRF
jgi:hypothetical protein